MQIKRVYVICEGQTEEMFIKTVMSEFFSTKGIYLFPALIGKPGRKGGNFTYKRLLTDVTQFLIIAIQRKPVELL